MISMCMPTIFGALFNLMVFFIVWPNPISIANAGCVVINIAVAWKTYKRIKTNQKNDLLREQERLDELRQRQDAFDIFLKSRSV